MLVLILVQHLAIYCFLSATFSSFTFVLLVRFIYLFIFCFIFCWFCFQLFLLWNPSAVVTARRTTSCICWTGGFCLFCLLQWRNAWPPCRWGPRWWSSVAAPRVWSGSSSWTSTSPASAGGLRAKTRRPKVSSHRSFMKEPNGSHSHRKCWFCWTGSVVPPGLEQVFISHLQVTEWSSHFLLKITFTISYS